MANLRTAAIHFALVATSAAWPAAHAQKQEPAEEARAIAQRSKPALAPPGDTLAAHPLTNALWGLDNGFDLHGDRVPPQQLNAIKAGANYGWPVCYADRVVDPMTNAPPGQLALKPGQSQPSREPMTREQYCARTEPATLLLPAHSAPIAMRFYTASQFPPAYRNDAFGALRGSWGRDQPVGYKVVRIRFDGAGRPVGVQDFLDGFLERDSNTAFGRPAGIAIAADGSLLVSEDGEGVIYRIAYTGRQ